MNLSKLVDEDEPLFLSLIDDMFPGIKLTTQTYKDLQKGIENAAISLGVINHPAWNLKTVQVSLNESPILSSNCNSQNFLLLLNSIEFNSKLYETSLVRHGLMVLGPTGSGKTRCMWALMKAMTDMGIPHKEVRMNPKVRHSLTSKFEKKFQLTGIIKRFSISLGDNCIANVR